MKLYTLKQTVSVYAYYMYMDLQYVHEIYHKCELINGQLGKEFHFRPL